MWMVLTLLSAGMRCTNVAPSQFGKKQNVIKRVSNCASCYRINSHHPTDHDRTLLRLQLHWLWGLRSSQNHRTLLEFIGFAFGNNQRDVQSLQSYPECMFFDWCLLQDYDRCDGLVTLVPQKQKSSNRKAQYGTSYPTHLTRLEEQMKTLPYLPYIGMALKLCTCRLFTRTTWHVDTCCYCRAWNLTWHFHFDHTRSALSTVTSRLHLL